MAPAPGRPDPDAAPPWLGLGLVCVLGTFWGLAFSLSKVAANAGVPPLGYAWWQSLGSGVVLLAVALWRRQTPPIDRRHLVYLAFMGAFGLGIPNALIYTVIAKIPVGLVSAITNMVPLFTYLISLALLLERFSPVRAAGVTIGLAGAAIVVLPGAGTPEPWMTGWVLLAMIGPACYAVSVVGGARWRPVGTPSLALAAGMLIAAGLMIAPVVIGTGSVYIPDPAALHAGDLAILGQVAITCAMFVVYFELMRIASPVVISLVGYLVTVTGIAWGMVLFGERHSPWLFVAVVLIFVGLALVNRSTDRRRGAASAADRA